MAASEFVTLKDGPTVPAAPLRLLIDLESRGFVLSVDDDTLVVQPHDKLTAEDRASIRRWKWHLLMLLAYAPPEVS